MSKRFLLLFAFTMMLVLVSCSDDDTSILDDNGLTKDINQLIPDSILTKMKEVGLPIYTGDNPPQVEFSFECAPYILKNSNMEWDEIGKEYATLYFKFFDQDNKNLKIKSYYEQASTINSGLGGYIVGEGNFFTIFLEVVSTSTDDNHTNIMTRVFSGEMTSNGIKNLHAALFMVDDNGDPEDKYMPIGGGRLFYDEDGFSEIIDDIEQSKIEKSKNASEIAQ